MLITRPRLNNELVFFSFFLATLRASVRGPPRTRRYVTGFLLSDRRTLSSSPVGAARGSLAVCTRDAANSLLDALPFKLEADYGIKTGKSPSN